VTFLFGAFGFILVIKVTQFSLPVLAAIWGVIRRLIELIFGFF
jgi:hypothetical protein